MCLFEILFTLPSLPLNVIFHLKLKILNIFISFYLLNILIVTIIIFLFYFKRYAGVEQFSSFNKWQLRFNTFSRPERVMFHNRKPCFVVCRNLSTSIIIVGILFCLNTLNFYSTEAMLDLIRLKLLLLLT